MVVISKTGGRKCYHFSRAWVIARSYNSAQREYKRWDKGKTEE